MIFRYLNRWVGFWKIFLALLIWCSSPVAVADICDPPPLPNERLFLEANHPNPLELETDESIYDSGSLRFFKGAGKYSTYFTLDVPLTPVSKVYEGIQTKLYPQLLRRDEAHITVLTPVEYYCFFGKNNVFGTPGISMDSIEKHLKKTFGPIDFLVSGLGSGQKIIVKEQRPYVSETFFLIVQSSDLVGLRKVLRQLLSGKAHESFQPGKYFPHITVGFTDSDLHEGDGVIKNATHSLDARFRVLIR